MTGSRMKRRKRHVCVGSHSKRGYDTGEEARVCPHRRGPGSAWPVARDRTFAVRIRDLRSSRRENSRTGDGDTPGRPKKHRKSPISSHGTPSLRPRQGKWHRGRGTCVSPAQGKRCLRVIGRHLHHVHVGSRPNQTWSDVSPASSEVFQAFPRNLSRKSSYCPPCFFGPIGSATGGDPKAARSLCAFDVRPCAPSAPSAQLIE